MNVNPLYKRLTQNSKWPSLRVCLWLTGGLLATGLILSSIGLLRLPFVEDRATQIWQGWDSDPLPASLRSTADYEGMLDLSMTWIAVFLTTLLLLICPLVVASVTAKQTIDDMPFGAKHLTTLPRTQIVRGYIYAGLHRTRSLLAIAIGSAPGLIGLYLHILTVSLILQTSANVVMPHGIPKPYHPTLLDITIPLALITVTAIGLLALNLLAAALGTALSMSRSITSTPANLAAIIILGGELFGINTLLTAVGPMIGGRGLSHECPDWLLCLSITSGLCLIPPILLTLGAIALARRWV